MKYRYIVILFVLLMCVMCAFPIKTNALEVGIAPQILDGCKDSTAILGDINCKDSSAYLIQQILNYIKVIAPTLVIILSSVDFISVIFNSNEEAMKKAQKKLVYRLIAAGLLFFLPLIVQILLGVFGFTSDITYGIG